MCGCDCDKRKISVLLDLIWKPPTSQTVDHIFENLRFVLSLQGLSVCLWTWTQLYMIGLITTSPQPLRPVGCERKPYWTLARKGRSPLYISCSRVVQGHAQSSHFLPWLLTQKAKGDMAKVKLVACLAVLSLLATGMYISVSRYVTYILCMSTSLWHIYFMYQYFTVGRTIYH